MSMAVTSRPTCSLIAVTPPRCKGLRRLCFNWRCTSWCYHVPTDYICDSFGLGGRREQDAEALRRCYAQLTPGGKLVFSHYLPYDDLERWLLWLPEERKRLPEQWAEEGGRKQAANGDEIRLRARVIDLDPIEQRQTLEMRAQLWRDGRLEEQE